MKHFMIWIICIILALGIYWGYGQFQEVIKENDQLKKTINDIPSTASEDIVTPTDEFEKGSISGKLGYPAEGIPELTVYAFNVIDEKIYFKVDTVENQGEFMITDIDPGSYYVVAYAKNYETSGAYTKAVACGLAVNCTDHAMIDVIVGSGETVTGIAVTDWYAPEGTFPKKP